MATMLYRLGCFAFRHRLTVLLAWCVLLGGAAATTLAAEPFVADFSVPGSGSERAQQIMDDKFPQLRGSRDLAAAQVVFQAPEGTTLDRPENRARVDELVRGLRGLEKLAAPQAVVDPLGEPVGAHRVSRDRTLAYVELTWTTTFDLIDEGEIAAFEEVLARSSANGLRAEATGSVFSAERVDSAAAESVGFGIAMIVMIIAFASLVAASLPIVTALFGVGISVSLLTGATAFFEMDSSSILLASMIGIAVSIDYSLFIVSRYRHEMNATDDLGHAAGRAVGTAGSSVVFAGMTVVIALVGLRVVDNPLMSMLGYTAALSVVVAVVAALTMLPALLGLLGRRAFALRVPGLRRGDEPDTADSHGARWVRRIAARPVLALVATTAVLGVFALPAADLELGMDVATADQKPAIELLGRGFGDGVVGRLVVAVDGSGTSRPEAVYRDLAAAIGNLPAVATVAPPQLNADRTGALIVVIPDSGPGTTQTRDLVSDIRGLERSFLDRDGIGFGVAGQTAMMSDLAVALYGALIPYLALVVGLAFLVLMLVFRSLPVPLIATLGFLLSIAATFGATVAVFQKGWFGLVADPEPVISFVPIYLIAILFGLAMDYQVFLVTRMREEYAHGPRTDAAAREAVVVGFRHGARVVTSAAFVMVSVFAAFVLLPDTIARTMGFALAIGMVFDAFLIRMIIVPALMTLLGRHAWYLPNWIDRILPDVDIEGRQLEKYDRSAELPEDAVAVQAG